MNEEQIRVLLVEDNPGDARLMREMLADASTGLFDVSHAGSLGEGLQRVDEQAFDVVLLDLSLPDSHGFATFESMHAHSPELPVLLITGLNDEDLAVNAVKQGAQDYLVKGQITDYLLSRAIRHAIERQRLRTQLEESAEELRILNQQKSDLVSFVSHELRSPLTSVKGYAVTLQTADSEEHSAMLKEFLDHIESEVDRLIRLIDGFLDISRIDAGREIELVTGTFDVRALVENAIAVENAVAVRCTIESSVAEDVNSIRADRDKLLQVLVNLLSNADKYSPAGGTVRIRVTKEGEFVRFVVSDEGMGIPQEALGLLFTPFYRLRDSARKTIRGTGLGLYLCKHLVAAHGGTIGVESEPEKGSTFYFTIPR